jgi:hypothetical protein
LRRPVPATLDVFDRDRLAALELIDPSGPAMVNRSLSLLVSVVAPASAAVMLVAGAHPIGTVTLAERAPCIGLAILASTLAIIHMRFGPTRSTRADAAMWQGLAIFFFVAAFVSPHFAVWSIVAALSLAATSVAKLVDSKRRSGGASPSPFRRRLFA